MLIVYDRALLDDKACITDGEFEQVLARFGLNSRAAMEKYDAVIHLVTCAKGAESFCNPDNNAGTETPEQAVELDDRTLRPWASLLRSTDHRRWYLTNKQHTQPEISRFFLECNPRLRDFKRKLVACNGRKWYDRAIK